MPPKAQILRLVFEIAAKRIDVQTAAPLVASVDAEGFCAATLLDIDKHALDAGFVKIIVLTV